MSDSDILTGAEVKKMKVNELKEALTAYGLSTKGVKSVLSKRLINHVESIDSAADIETPVPGASTEDDNLLSPDDNALKSVDTTLIATTEKKSVDSQLSDEDLKRKRAERFGMPFLSGQSMKTERAEAGVPSTASHADRLDGALGKKRSRGKKGKKSPMLLVDLNDPSVQKRIARFGAPSGDSAFAIAYRAAEDRVALKKRQDKFGVSDTGNETEGNGKATRLKIIPADAEKQSVIDARKARFTSVPA